MLRNPEVIEMYEMKKKKSLGVFNAKNQQIFLATSLKNQMVALHILNGWMDQTGFGF